MLVRIAPDMRLFVDIEGSGLVPDGPVMREKPTLILMHGGPGFDHTGFKPTFSALADVAQIVYYDHRGHGRSDPCPPSDWTLDTFADDLVRLCDVLGIVKPIVLGHSFGGFVAQRYIARHPEHPGKVVLSSTSAAMNLPRKLAMFEQLGGVAAREAARAFWTSPGESTWAVYEEICRPLYSQVATNPESAKRGQFKPQILFEWSGGEMQAMNLAPGLAAAKCPVLVWGGELDPVCPIEDSRDLAAALPAQWRQFEAVPSSGHGVWRDNPEVTLARLRRFAMESLSSPPSECRDC